VLGAMPKMEIVFPVQIILHVHRNATFWNPVLTVGQDFMI